MAEEKRKQVLVRLGEADLVRLASAADTYADGNATRAVQVALVALVEPCGDWAKAVLQTHRLEFRQAALEAWAREVAEAAQLVERLIKPDEWRFLAWVLPQRTWTGQEQHPGAAMAAAVQNAGHENPVRAAGLSGGTVSPATTRAVNRLAAKLSPLSAAGVWAILLAVWSCWERGGPGAFPVGAAWWKIGERVLASSGSSAAAPVAS